MTTYTFLKALALLISKMQQYRAENNFPQRNSTKKHFFSSQIYTFLDIYGCLIHIQFQKMYCLDQLVRAKSHIDRCSRSLWFQPCRCQFFRLGGQIPKKQTTLITFDSIVLTGFRARSHICNHLNNKPPCELAISRENKN